MGKRNLDKMTPKKFFKYILPYRLIVHKDKLLNNFFIFAQRKCPICTRKLFRFKSWRAPMSAIEQKELICPYCGSHPRHRKLWLYLNKKTQFFKMTEAHFLHVAPEHCFSYKFQQIFKKYLTADLSGLAMVKMDITNIDYPDNSFDIIFCNHVLEHIQNDIKAMSELYRVLKEGGMAILLVPMSSNNTTYEDRSIVAPEKRLEAFGHHDHVRFYGKDYLERLQSVGFAVLAISEEEYLSQKEIKRYSGINDHYDIIVQCTK